MMEKLEKWGNPCSPVVKFNNKDDYDKAKNIQDKYRALFNSDLGQQVFEDLISYCSVYRNSFHQNRDQSSFNQGKQEIGYYVLKQLFVELTYNNNDYKD